MSDLLVKTTKTEPNQKNKENSLVQSKNTKSPSKEHKGFKAKLLKASEKLSVTKLTKRDLKGDKEKVSLLTQKNKKEKKQSIKTELLNDTGKKKEKENSKTLEEESTKLIKIFLPEDTFSKQDKKSANGEAEKTSNIEMNTKSFLLNKNERDVKNKKEALLTKYGGYRKVSKKVKLVVQDKRSVESSKNIKVSTDKSHSTKFSKPHIQTPKNISSSSQQEEAHDIEIELHNDLVDGNEISVEGSGKKIEVSSSKQFATVLKDRLDKSTNNQIVDQAKFVLKDGNAGEIKLILKPESLGRVRIQIDMHEKNIVGKIFVENNIVKQVFEDNMSSLNRSFNSAGYQTSIDVEVGGQGQKQYQPQEDRSSRKLNKLHITDIGNSVPETLKSGREIGESLINLMA
ncbi:flagellar hook-length control protein FliK [Spirochaeta cellobiosiphila]|uniref:flagellar hook-length control protein FliK n=1 Tax=Spirochaeta cellobiosiphila TaxID=504483 RepID=UPI000403E0DB|nr:flagellar hook-length control protein FliK [Spirochaeta cellobiosiphila]